MRRNVPTRTILGALLAALAGAGCAGPTVTKIHGPDGTPAYRVQCVRDDDICYETAEKLCLEKGFEVLDARDNNWPRGTGAFEAAVVVRCRGGSALEQDGGAAGRDAGSDAIPKRRQKSRKAK